MNYSAIFLVPSALFGVFSILSCNKEKTETPVREGSYIEVRAILDRSCMSCHASQSPRLMTYEDVKSVATTGALLKSLDSNSVKAMPPGAPLPPEEINSIKLWIQNGMKAE